MITFLPIKRSIERLQQSFSRQDAKAAKKNIFLFLRTWRPLRLCERPSLSDPLNPNSTENFKYVWLALVNGFLRRTLLKRRLIASWSEMP